MYTCSYCGEDIDNALYHQCNFCNEVVCPDHMLPENHDCKNLGEVEDRYFDKDKFRFKRPQDTNKNKKTIDKSKRTTRSKRRKAPKGPDIKSKNTNQPKGSNTKTTKHNWKHIAIAILIIVSVITIAFAYVYNDINVQKNASEETGDMGGSTPDSSTPSIEEGPNNYETIEISTVSNNKKKYVGKHIYLDGTLKERDTNLNSPYRYVLSDEDGSQIIIQPHSSSTKELEGKYMLVGGEVVKKPLRRGGHEYVFKVDNLVGPKP